jgi:glycosyltransferase involved in cell wall biosynthesis
MKILMASSRYPPQLGGIARHVGSLSEELSKRGHQVSVCTMAFRGRPRWTKNNQPRIYELSPGLFPRLPFLYRTSNRFPPPIPDPILVRQLKSVLQKEKPDIVHAHDSLVQSLIPVLKHFDVPLVVTIHSYGVICPTSGRGEISMCNMSLSKHCIVCSRQLYGFGPLGTAKCLAVYFATKKNKNIVSSVSRFIAVSSYVKQVHLQNLSLRDDDIVVIPNFYARDTRGRTEITTKLPECYILFVGRLIPEKGMDTLIDAYCKLHTETKLVLIGAKDLAYHCKSIENIMVIENAPYSLVTEAYQNCRFAIFPSIWPEPFGTVTLEAMSHKKAVIASRIGGFIDAVVEGETGILVPPNDPNALANAIKYLLENPGVAGEMGQKGYERWHQFFTPEVVVPKIEQLYYVLSHTEA